MVEALFRAIRGNDIDRVNSLIEAGANVNTADSTGTTALILASGEGHDGIVERLIRARANVNAAEFDGTTPIIRASYYWHRARILLPL